MAQSHTTGRTEYGSADYAQMPPTRAAIEAVRGHEGARVNFGPDGQPTGQVNVTFEGRIPIEATWLIRHAGFLVDSYRTETSEGLALFWM